MWLHPNSYRCNQGSFHVILTSSIICFRMWTSLMKASRKHKPVSMLTSTRANYGKHSQNTLQRPTMNGRRSSSNALSRSNGISQMVYGRSQPIARKHIAHGYHELRWICQILSQVFLPSHNSWSESCNYLNRNRVACFSEVFSHHYGLR